MAAYLAPLADASRIAQDPGEGVQVPSTIAAGRRAPHPNLLPV